MDDFREWLSDYLRYFELGGAILVVLLILIFGVRACTKSRSANKEEVVQQKEETVEADTEDQTTADTSTDSTETVDLEAANAEITELVKNYFQAVQANDLDTLNTLVDELSPSDEARIANSNDYITGYQVGDVYVKEGLDTNSSVVYAYVTYTCTGMTTSVPSLVQFYVKKNADGTYVIDGSAETDPQISAYTSGLQKDAAVQALTKKVQDEYDKALAGDSALAAFLSGLGTESGASTGTTTDDSSKTLMVTNDDVNVRDSAAGDKIDGLDVGTQVEVLGREDDWYHVRYNGSEEGYIYADLLDPVNN